MTMSLGSPIHALRGCFIDVAPRDVELVGLQQDVPRMAQTPPEREDHAPPMSRASALSIKLSMTPSFLAPSTHQTTTVRPFGLSVRRWRPRPRPRRGLRQLTEAGWRCSYTLSLLAVDDSESVRTKTSARPASCSAKARRIASSLLVSPGLNRTFFQYSNVPVVKPSVTLVASAPTVSAANATSRSSRSLIGPQPERAKRRIRLAIWPTHVGYDQDAGAGLRQPPNRRNARADTPSSGWFDRRAGRSSRSGPAHAFRASLRGLRWCGPCQYQIPWVRASCRRRREVGKTVGIAPLVVVPGVNLT